METLPVEMLEKIIQQLTIRDLVNCSAVCREWRETFNQDWIWKPHCDPELEEPLRTIPPVATPKFVTPEVENSTLTPICRWRLAYMRETHLWNNWGREDILEENERMIGENVLQVDFLSNTLIVVWYRDCIKIIDLTLTNEIVAETDSSIAIEELNRRSVIGTTMLLVEKDLSVDIYSVDLANKLITLKNCITFNVPNATTSTRVVKGQLYFFVDNEIINLKVFDLNTGKTLKEEPIPLELSNENAEFYKIGSSSTSDFVAVAYSDNEGYELCLYNIEQLIFLTDVVKVSKDYYRIMYGINVSADDRISFHFALHDKWLAYNEDNYLIVYNIQTRQVLLRHEVRFEAMFMPNSWVSGIFLLDLFVSENSFICIESDVMTYSRVIKISPELNTVTTIMKGRGYVFSENPSNEKHLILVHVLREYPPKQYLWRHSSKIGLKRYELPQYEGPSTVLANESLTCIIFPKNDTWYANFVW